GTISRLTSTGRATVLAWAPDSRHLAFQSGGNAFTIFWVRSDGSGDPQRLLENPDNVAPACFSPDGRRLAYFGTRPDTGFDIWTLPLDLADPDHPKPGKPELFLGTPADEVLPRFSMDGRWIAYRSNESGNSEIYVRPFPLGSGAKWRISSGGGLYAFWA